MTDDVTAGSAEPVLIVDDEKNIRRTLRMVLESEGHTVHEAGSIAEADGILARETVDVILLDVKLGDDNGLDLLRSLKARGDEVTRATADIPVVMISGHATIEDAGHFLQEDAGPELAQVVLELVAATPTAADGLP